MGLTKSEVIMWAHVLWAHVLWAHGSAVQDQIGDTVQRLVLH